MTATVLRRRNGRPQACDPCRSRKVSCDHAQPVCLRCQRRKQQDRCVYTISSHSVLSESSGPKRTAIPSSRPGVRADSRSSLSDSSPSSPTTRTGTPKARTGAPTPRTGAPTTRAGTLKPTASRLSGGTTTPASAPAPATALSGYLGSASYSAVYQETSRSLSRLQGGSSVPVQARNDHHVGVGACSNGTACVELTNLSPLTREMCFKVLRCLPDIASASVPPGVSPDLCIGWVSVAVSRVLHSVQTHLRSYCDPNIDDASLEELARVLCANTARSVSENDEDVDAWLAQFSGENLRWESLGLLFTSRNVVSGWQSAGRGGRNPLDCLGLCIELARKFSDGNLLQLHLLFRRTHMESIGVGDAGISCWRAHAETIALLTFLGLHAEPETPPSSSYTPTFISELRRRLFAYIFNVDKVSASFQGRPPLLSCHYVSPPLPLDIPDEDFIGGDEALLQAVVHLDEKGWNTTGRVSTATLIRARVKLAYLKDELIGLVLSPNKHTSAETLWNIKARLHEVLAELPPALRYDPTDIDRQDIHVEVLYARMLLHVEYLQSLFFLERLLQRHGNGSGRQPDPSSRDGELVLISFDMVALTVQFWMHGDRFVGKSNNFEWLVMNYAAPGGGILCMELLRPTFTGPHHPRSTKITRSSLIQQLSLLVGFLGWVSPGAPNADLCASCRVVIQHVLDHTLNVGVASSQNHQEQRQRQEDAVPALDQPLGDVFAQGVDTENLFFGFDLLDTYDWLRDDMGTEGFSM